jgi:hypothetical protein
VGNWDFPDVKQRCDENKLTERAYLHMENVYHLEYIDEKIALRTYDGNCVFACVFSRISEFKDTSHTLEVWGSDDRNYEHSSIDGSESDLYEL